MKYIKLFETAAAYNAATLDLPNVSLIEENMSMHFNPYVPPETRVVAKYNVTDISSPTLLCNLSAVSKFSEIEIDGVVQPSVDGTYTFSTTGEHTVKYTLTDQTSIGNSAFNNCSSLTSIIIPNGVTSIDAAAFGLCSNLTSIVIPNSVTSIGGAAFRLCTSLTSIIIPNSVTSIVDYAFIDCSGLTSINIPSGVTSIGANVFSGCSSLTSIVMPNGVTSIGNYAFGNCSGLTSIVIPSGVTSIGQNAFNGCSNLTSIVCNAMTAPTIQSNTFNNVNTDGTLTVPIDSTGYDVWMGTGDYYLGYYNWTKIEQ